MRREQESFDIPLEIYFRELAQHPPLPPEEEKELIEKAKRGDKSAKEKLVVSHLRFVVEIAAKYREMGVPLSDLINEGNLGLLRAISHYDPNRGIKFLSYAVWWIRAAILKALNEQAQLIRVPVEQRHRLRRVRKAEEEFRRKFGSEPSVQELSEITGLSKKKIEFAFNIFQKELSIDKSPAGKEEMLWNEVFEQKSLPSPEVFYKKEHFKEEFEKALNSLSSREKFIVEKSYGMEDGIPMTLEQIGNELGISRERVRQIREKSLKKLREVLSKYFYLKVENAT